MLTQMLRCARHPVHSCASSSFLTKQGVSNDHVILPFKTADSQSMLLIRPGVVSCQASEITKTVICRRTIGMARGKTGSMRKSDRTMMWTWRGRTRKQGMPRPAHQGTETSSCITHAW